MLQKQVKKQQNVLIKGTKAGLTFYFNDQCSFAALIAELQEKISERPKPADADDAFVRVKLVTGNRYLEEEQMKQLEQILTEHINGVIDSVDSNVVSKKEAEAARHNHEVSRLVKIVRSGQVIETTGDLLLIGDVNPGATVRATGSIYIMGKLRGMAHAGYDGKKQAVICASSMLPTQLRIADVIRTPPEEASGQWMECAYLDDSGKIVVEPVQRLVSIRPELTSFIQEKP
ncbi:septum site-determining protein MinC [Evansella caseinilytica]|uniref:Probable septum site-determining protein MinC n=1 Tax=Evansella caseinilytica TaxID=1503961 RepID=A0A1H3PRI8_9BACI|nr:septum site-determining protein MinC [Evansella caseinilytica]SDZ03892.1 septum site-determining protein MinC [Evansella caseinilytica]